MDSIPRQYLISLERFHVKRTSRFGGANVDIRKPLFQSCILHARKDAMVHSGDGGGGGPFYFESSIIGYIMVGDTCLANGRPTDCCCLR